MGKVEKNPWLSAIFNFTLFGLGYVYNGKRVGFGIGLIIAGLLIRGLLTGLYVSLSSEVWIVLHVSSLIFSFLFAYDGYKESIRN